MALTACLLGQVARDYGRPIEDSQPLARLEEEKKRCLLRRGLDSSGVMENNETYSSLLCPSGDGVYPADLCTVRSIYLNHDARKFVARVPPEMTSR